MDNIDQKINEYIEGLVSGVLSMPSLQNLTPKEKEEYAQKLRDHFSNLIIETSLNRMNPEQLADIQNNVQNPEELEKKMEEYSSQIPGLAEDLEARLQGEFEAMKMTLSTLPQ